MKAARRQATRIGYEARDIQPRQVAYSAAALFSGLALSIGLVAGLFAVLHRIGPMPAASAVESAPLAPPLPRLEIDGRADRAAVEADAERKLEGYAWADTAAGTARVPIARAMQILAAHGWPDDPSPAP
jgi:hypothetical protein